MHNLKLVSIHCHVSDESDLDEVYLVRNGSKIWPESSKFQRLEIGETPVNLELEDMEKGSTIEIELWDHDTLSKDDKLGTFHLMLDQFGSGFQTEMKKHSGTRASYSLDWEYY